MTQGIRHVMLLIGVLAAACSGANMKTYSAVDEKTDYDEDQLFGAATRAIDKLDYRPVGTDREGHTVSTREKEVGYSSVPRLFYRYSFEINTEGGRLRITAHCTMNSATDREGFEECGDERPKQVIEKQRELSDTILDLAKEVPGAPSFDEGPPPSEAADGGAPDAAASE